MKKIVTVDFDNTLSRKSVQRYISQLLHKGIDVWVLTSRYDVLHQHLYPGNPTNEDLWLVIDNLGIPRWKVRFTNMLDKFSYLEQTKAIWHLDDDSIELNYINEHTKTKGISVISGTWKHKCNKLLGL